MNIYEQQFSCPTNFQNGINVGDFYVPNQLSQGLPAGLVQPYLVSPTLANSEFLSGTIAANTTSFVTLSNVQDTANNKYVIVNNNLEDPGLKLDCERGFRLLMRENGNALVSGYDRYGQKMTWADVLPKDEEVDVPRAFAKISSIQLTNLSGSPANFSITSNYDIGLPYNALQGIIPLAVNIESLNDFFNILLYQSIAPGNPITTFYTYKETETQTIDSGRPRPMINVDPNGSVFYTLNGNAILTVWQLVYGAGTLPHYIIDPTTYERDVNSLETVIGKPPFNEGWIGWQG